MNKDKINPELNLILLNDSLSHNQNESNIFLCFLEWFSKDENLEMVNDFIFNKKDFYIKLKNEQKIFKLNFYQDDIFSLKSTIFEENKYEFFEHKHFYLNFRKVFQQKLNSHLVQKLEKNKKDDLDKVSLMLKKFKDFKLNNKHLDLNLNEMVAKFIVHYFLI